MGDNEENQFFDALEDITSEPDGPELSHSGCVIIDDCELTTSRFKVWKDYPQSVDERRSRFLNSMDLNFGSTRSKSPTDASDAEFGGEFDRITKNGGAVLRTLSSIDEFSCNMCKESSILCRNGNSEGGIKHINEDKYWKIGNQREPQVVCSVPISQREAKVERNTLGIMNEVKKRWWSRFRSMTCIADRQVKTDNLRTIREARVGRVRVHQCGKQAKELSALFTGQDIQAHEGSISAMKFSDDGQYLASAGEDGIVRVWQVVEDERSNDVDIRDTDPSCLYFTVNDRSELSPLAVEKEKMRRMRSVSKRAASACVVFPQKFFRILEKPLHEFYGHSGEILDLSWSTNNCLLSSSVDKTVRLWQVGCRNCLEVFPHSNYVTCIQFNPVNDNYFISGSIDGKVRVWEINGCRVVDWIDVREIVTAVCYRPDGQGGIVGSMTGTCSFYNVSDNHIEVEGRICLHSKRKSQSKRITGFQYFPQDPCRVMVTCADSQVRILHGIDVIGKYQGSSRNGGNQIFASFTSDGKHIVSACEDSNVYLWNCNSDEDSSSSQPKSVRSFEHFSTNASVALTWSGMKLRNSENELQLYPSDRSSPTLPFSSPTCLSLGQDIMLEPFPKASATWPEENLPISHPLPPRSSPLCKSQYKLLKNSCRSTSVSHAWGMVIVTASWDGRIRSFHNYGLPIPT